jgi:hypothetical protein
MKLLIYLTLFSLFAGCSSNTKADHENNPAEINSIVSKKTPPFKLRDVTIKWTAFKHSTKAQVGGKFDSVSVYDFKESNNLLTSISNVSFKIPISSTNTNDKTRDYKIINSFFKVLANTDFIYGSIKKMNPNGSGLLSLKMNNLEIDKDFKWEYDKINREVFIKTSIDVLNWGAQEALDALNTVCLEKHTGPDGENKLWPNVDIVVFAGL